MAVTQYIGARYVPIFADPAEWSNAKQYEPLTVVLHEGNSYTSRQFVPVGVDINNTAYWAETGNYNAQVEAYRQEVLRVEQENIDISSIIPVGAFSSSNTVKDYIDSKHDDYLTPDNFEGTDTEKVQAAFDALEANGGTMILNRTYEVENVTIRHNTSANTRITVIGLGKNCVLNVTGSINGSIAGLTGGVTFINVHFTGSANCFETDNLIRMYFIGCMFNGFANVFHGQSSLAQTIYCSMCYFRTISNCVFLNTNIAYDVRFEHCTVESSRAFMEVASTRNVTVFSCCIEGMSGFVFKGNRSLHSVTFSSNYFELNAVNFDLSNTSCTCAAVHIEKNEFIHSLNGTALVLVNPSIATINGRSLVVTGNNLADVTHDVAYIEFSAQPRDGYQLTGVTCKNIVNSNGGNNKEFRNYAGYILPKEYNLQPYRGYEFLGILFAPNGSRSMLIQMPYRTDGSYRPVITGISFEGIGSRDVSLYRIGGGIREVGFYIECTNAAEREVIKGGLAFVNIRFEPSE